MVLAKAEVIENMDQAIKLGKEIERVESALKAMKAELKAFVMLMVQLIQATLFGITQFLHRGNLMKRE